MPGGVAHCVETEKPQCQGKGVSVTGTALFFLLHESAEFCLPLY
jgi:hypothetical protein